MTGVQTCALPISNAKGKFMPLVHVMVGKEKDGEQKVAENILSVFESITNTGNVKKQNVKSSFVKLTMGPAVKIGINEKDLKDIPEEVMNELSFIKVETVEEVLKETLNLDLPGPSVLFSQMETEKDVRWRSV